MFLLGKMFIRYVFLSSRARVRAFPPIYMDNFILEEPKQLGMVLGTVLSRRAGVAFAIVRF